MCTGSQVTSQIRIEKFSFYLHYPIDSLQIKKKTNLKQGRELLQLVLVAVGGLHRATQVSGNDREKLVLNFHDQINCLQNTYILTTDGQITQISIDVMEWTLLFLVIFFWKLHDSRSCRKLRTSLSPCLSFGYHDNKRNWHAIFKKYKHHFSDITETLKFIHKCKYFSFFFLSQCNLKTEWKLQVTHILRHVGKKRKRIHWACSLTFLASCTNWCHWVLNWRLELTWVFHDSYVVLSMVILSVYSDTILSTVFAELLMSMVESSWICRKQNYTLNTTFISDSVNYLINYI